MRHTFILILTFAVTACSGASVRHAATTASPTENPSAPSQNASVESVVEFLIQSAAHDFHMQRPTEKLSVRDVRMRHLLGANGEKQYRLCGEVLMQEASKVDWIPFVTIKTSGYEQYIGGQATSFCHESSLITDEIGDLSSALQKRLDAPR